MNLELAILDNYPEIFYTIQGEGKSTGKPSVFIRLANCNLNCIWCDTAYTWNWENTSFEHQSKKKYTPSEYRKKYTFEEISTLINTFPCQHLVITGGEPLLQQKRIVIFLEQLQTITKKTYTVEIETNGTILPNKELDKMVEQYNISPKLSNAGMKKEKTTKENVIDFFSKNLKSNFKFVIDSAQDLQEVLILQKTFEISSSKIYLMPEGNSPTQLVEKRENIIEICKQYGFMFTDRLHVHVYGTKRGV